MLRLLPTLVQFRLWPLFLALMSMHKNAASSPAQSPTCFADLYIYVEFVPLSYANILLLKFLNL